MIEAETFNQSLPIVEQHPKLKEVIRKNKMPWHLCIIPDGNGRFAKKLHQTEAIFGHIAGANKVRDIFRDLRGLPGIGIVTIWGFSTDNWKRPPEEVNALMGLFKYMIEDNLEELKADNVKFIHLGSKDRISPDLRETLIKAEEQTANNTGKKLCLAIDFGGVDQMHRLANKAIQVYPDRGQTGISLEETLSLLDGNGEIPPANLIIRTSGEMRLSDIGWLNGAPTEIYKTKKLFPSITTKDIVGAILDYAKREKRLGGRPEIIKKTDSYITVFKSCVKRLLQM